jgi:hypothetical protein
MSTSSQSSFENRSSQKWEDNIDNMWQEEDILNQELAKYYNKKVSNGGELSDEDEEALDKIKNALTFLNIITGKEEITINGKPPNSKMLQQLYEIIQSLIKNINETSIRGGTRKGRKTRKSRKTRRRRKSRKSY